MGVSLVALVSAAGLDHVNAQVFISPQKNGQETKDQPKSSSVFLTPPALKRPQSTANAPTPYTQQTTPKYGVALTASQYNDQLLKQQQERKAAQAANPALVPLVGAVSKPVTIEDDGETYYDDATGMFMTKSAFAAELWGRGQDPNALYPGKFPAPPKPEVALPMAGNSTWSNTMPTR